MSDQIAPAEHRCRPVMSEQIDQLAAALSATQAEIEGAERDANNPHFRSQYATLGSVWDACKSALTKNGLSVAQFAEPAVAPGTLCLVTMLMHKSGQFITGTEVIRLSKDDAQGYGSAMTYARRYGLAAMVGVCPEDDDGNAAIARPSSTVVAGPAPADLYQSAAQPQEPEYRWKIKVGEATPEQGKWFLTQIGSTAVMVGANLGAPDWRTKYADFTFEDIDNMLKLKQRPEAVA